MKREDLIFKHPDLWVLQAGDKPRVVAAKNIRKELERLYPNTKFSVRSESFANGNAVRIVWAGGPSQYEINELTAKYELGGFDAMNDCYTEKETDWNKTFGGAVFVTTHRHMDELTEAR